MKRIFPAAISVLSVAMAFTIFNARAQEGADAGGAKTPEAAARQFMLALSVPRFGEQPNLFILISKRDWAELTHPNVERLMAQMNDFVAGKRWKARVVQRDKDSAIVNITPLANSEPVTCFRDGDIWRVDLIETWRNWNGCTEKQIKQKILDDIGVALPGVVIPKSQESAACRERMKQLGLALQLYSQDYDRKMPPALHWATNLQPYAINETQFNCPSVAPKQNGYAFNANISSLRVENEPWKIVAFYETTNLKPDAFGTGHDIAFRHARDTNFIMANGDSTSRFSSEANVLRGFAMSQ